MALRLNVTLDVLHAAKLSHLAKQARTREETLAASLLSHALDEVDPPPRQVADLLDAVPGAHERALLGREQGRAGNTKRLEDL